MTPYGRKWYAIIPGYISYPIRPRKGGGSQERRGKKQKSERTHGKQKLIIEKKKFSCTCTINRGDPKECYLERGGEGKPRQGDRPERYKKSLSLLGTSSCAKERSASGRREGKRRVYPTRPAQKSSLEGNYRKENTPAQKRNQENYRQKKNHLLFYYSPACNHHSQQGPSKKDFKKWNAREQKGGAASTKGRKKAASGTSELTSVSPLYQAETSSGPQELATGREHARREKGDKSSNTHLPIKT